MLAQINWDDWLNTSTVKFDDDYFANDDVNAAKQLALDYIQLAGDSSPLNKD